MDRMSTTSTQQDKCMYAHADRVINWNITNILKYWCFKFQHISSTDNTIQGFGKNSMEQIKKLNKIISSINQSIIRQFGGPSHIICSTSYPLLRLHVSWIHGVQPTFSINQFDAYQADRLTRSAAFAENDPLPYACGPHAMYSPLDGLINYPNSS